jgi:hypothetical protein
MFGPDVLTLKAGETKGDRPLSEVTGATALANAPPKVKYAAQAEAQGYTKKQRTLVIRHSSDDRIIAMIEILSPGNKDDRPAMHKVVKKVLGGLRRGYHFLILDLLPPGPGDPRGIHGAIWAKISKPLYKMPPEKPLTLVSYVARMPFEAYIEPTAVGDSLTAMPLFLDPKWYVSVPLEETYEAAWTTLPRQVREQLGSPSEPH